jgi:hypothetical protein
VRVVVSAAAAIVRVSGQRAGLRDVCSAISGRVWVVVLWLRGWSKLQQGACRRSEALAIDDDQQATVREDLVG